MRPVAFVRSFGAGRVSDYTRESFLATKPRCHVMLDFAAYHSPFVTQRALRRGGRNEHAWIAYPSMWPTSDPTADGGNPWKAAVQASSIRIHADPRRRSE